MHGAIAATLTLVLAACQTPPDAPPTPPPRPCPGLQAVVELAWLPPSRGIARGAGFVLTGQGARVEALAVAPDYTVVHSFPGAPVVLPDAPTCSVGDFDGDGSDEVLAKNGTDFVVYPFDGKRPYVVGRRASLLDDGSDGPWLSGRACDWNGDGRADLAVARDHDIVVLTDTLAGSWTGIALGDLPEADGEMGLVATAGDFDGDGLPDLVFASPRRGLLWCRNDGTRTEPHLGEPRPLWPAEVDTFVTAVLLHDVDGDGWRDVLACRAQRGAHGFELHERRHDRSPLEDGDLAAASRELDDLLQTRRRAAVGLDPDAPLPHWFGSDLHRHASMPAEEQQLRARIRTLESRAVAVQPTVARAYLRCR